MGGGLVWLSQFHLIALIRFKKRFVQIKVEETGSFTGFMASVLNSGGNCGMGQIIKLYEMAILSSLNLLKSTFKSNY